MCDVKGCKKKDLELTIEIDGKRYEICNRCWKRNCDDKDDFALDKMVKR